MGHKKPKILVSIWFLAFALGLANPSVASAVSLALTSVQPSFSDTIGSSTVLPNGLIKISGKNFDLVTSVEVDGSTANFEIKSPKELVIRIPSSALPGDASIKLMGAFETVVLQGQFEIVAPLDSPRSKVTVGSFLGNVAVYTKAHSGKRLSFKVGDQWKVIDKLPKQFTANLKRVGKGKTVTVMVYIDRVLVGVKVLRVR